jgi:hypothetical protein
VAISPADVALVPPLDLDSQLLNLRNEALLFGEGGDESSKPRTS